MRTIFSEGLQVLPTESGLLGEPHAPGHAFFMGYSVYILRSLPSQKYYVGSTGNMVQRMLFHNELGDGFTSKYRPWEIVYVRECESKVVAQQLERKIKSWKSRVMIGRLLNGEDDLL